MSLARHILAACVAFSILTGCSSEVQGSAGSESTTYLNRIVPQIFNHWDVTALYNQASAEFREASPRPAMARFFSAARRTLGSLQHYKVGNSIEQTISSPTGTYTHTLFTVAGRFQKANANIYIEVIKKSSRWKISGLKIESQIFIP
jgi:hypothetical protein